MISVLLLGFFILVVTSMVTGASLNSLVAFARDKDRGELLHAARKSDRRIDECVGCVNAGRNQNGVGLGSSSLLDPPLKAVADRGGIAFHGR